MKKVILGVLAVLAISSLVACENQKEVEPIHQDTTIVENNENTNNVESLTNEEMYNTLIDDYKKAFAEYDLEDMDIDEKIEQNYNMLNLSLLAHVARYANNGIELTYNFYDIDKNGVDELIVGASGSNGAIYSYDKTTNQPVKLFFQETLERGNLIVYDNGIILSEGAGGAALHYYEYGKISSDGTTYEMLESVEEEYIEENEPPVYKDYTTGNVLNYKSLDEIQDKYLLKSSESDKTYAEEVDFE